MADEGEMINRHFRLYFIEDSDGVKRYDAGESWTADRAEALVYEGDEYYAADLADSDFQVEWCNEDEEMNKINAPRLPGM